MTVSIDRPVKVRSAPVATPPTLFTPRQLQRLNAALQPLHAQYDPDDLSLCQPFTSPGYHTTLKDGTVHPTRESLHYAVALLDTGDVAHRDRAQAIIRRIVSEQDQDAQSKTYGIWSWFLEEPLSQMAPPDWNWADFCGVALLQIALDHRQQIEPELMELVDASIIHATRSIRRRDVQANYTNIAIMGSYVTLISAELYDLPELKAYAMERLRRIHEYTFHQGGFTEYNSPTYTVVALTELARLLQHAKDEEARELASQVYHRAWQEVSDHFHVPTRQWAGPHSRSYSSLIQPPLLAMIERSISAPLGWNLSEQHPSIEEHRVPTPCPHDLQDAFIKLEASRTVVRTFFRDPPALIGHTYLSSEFALGSINRGDCWNQRRCLIGYWGTAQAPSYLHLRFLHDGYDFAAAQIRTVQHEGRVLAAITFALDGGDTHLIFDRLIDGQFNAEDLRVRFEIGGIVGDAAPAAPPEATTPVRLRFGDLHLLLAVPVVEFGGHRPYWKISRDNATLNVDQVLYHGERRSFSLLQMKSAVAGIAVAIAAGLEARSNVIGNVEADQLHLKWDELTLTASTTPARIITV